MSNLINLIIKSIGLLLVGVLIYEVPFIYHELKYAVSPFSSYEVMDQSNQEENIFDTGSKRFLKPINLEKNFIIPKLGINEELFIGEEEEFGVYIPNDSRKIGSSGEVIIKTFHKNAELQSRKNAQYALLYKLKAGDAVVIHYHGQRVNYLVEEITRVPSALYLEGIEEKYENALRIDTQWPPGFYSQKMLIYATQTE